MVLSKAGGRLVEEVQVCSRNVPGFLVKIFPRTYFGTLGNRIQAGKKKWMILFFCRERWGSYRSYARPFIFTAFL